MPYVRNTRYRELFKKGGSNVWWCFVPNPDGGRALRETTGQRDERAAHRYYLARIRQSVRGPHQASDQKERTLLGALDARIEWLKAARILLDDPTRKKPSAATIDFYIKKSRQLVRVLGGDTLLSEIGHEQMRAYIVQRTKETAVGSTISRELTALSKAMALARKDGVHCAVFRDIKPEDFRAVYVPRTRWLTEAELDALLEVLPAKRAAVVAFIVSTSATYPSEVVPVTRAMVDAKTGVVHIPGTKRATRKRTIVVPSHARKYLAFALKHAGADLFEPWSNVRRDLDGAAARLSTCAACLKAGRKRRDAACPRCKATPPFAHLSPNDLRRTFAQWLVRSGVPNELVSPLMGHKDTRMVEKVYGKRDVVAVAELVEIALRRAPRGARSASS